MRGASPEDVAREVHEHAVRQVRRKGGMAYGFMTDFSGTTVTVALRGSSTTIPGVRYIDTFVPSSYSTIPEVVLMLTGDGDIVVVGALA